MYSIKRSKQFERSFKKLQYGGVKIVIRQEVSAVIDLLSSGKKLPDKYNDHQLKGEYLGYRECHVRPDLLLIYQIQNKELILVLIDIGSHSSLFQ